MSPECSPRTGALLRNGVKANRAPAGVETAAGVPCGPVTPEPRTKIVCTLGSRDPADPSLPQNAPDFVERLAAAGMSVARLSLSHNRSWSGGGEGFEREDRWLDALDRVNGAAGAKGRRVAAMADLQG